MKDLLIYHPGTGTVISLSDPCYLVDASLLSEEMVEEMSNGEHFSPLEHKGWRIDNYNMTNLFFGRD